MGRIKSKIVNGMADVLSAPSRMVSAAKGMMADQKRGMLLYKQGYGKYYDSARTVAKKGRKYGKEH